MKLQLASLAFGLVASFTVCATPISTWTFESATPFDLDNSGTSPVVAANTGIGSASGTHASSATDWKTREGNGSVRSISANNWAVGDYWQFEVSTVGYENITVSWDQMSSGTGPRDFGLFYSSDGALFTQFLSSFTVGASYTSFSKDLSAVIGISDDSSVFFRVQAVSGTAVNGNAVGSSGTSRIDNFTVSGTEIVRPPVSAPDAGGSFLLLSLALGGVACASRRVVVN